MSHSYPQSETLAERVEGENPIRRVADRTARTLSSAADYIRNHDAQTIWSDFSAVLRRHPAESLAAALVLGVIIGRLIYNNDSSANE
jgi:hypothetical protein